MTSTLHFNDQTAIAKGILPVESIAMFMLSCHPHSALMNFSMVIVGGTVLDHWLWQNLFFSQLLHFC
tara:strand:- start:571 stop:771 length:201 start_codon:yes stop_codon:yes gene_type:complete